MALQEYKYPVKKVQLYSCSINLLALLQHDHGTSYLDHGDVYVPTKVGI